MRLLMILLNFLDELSADGQMGPVKIEMAPFG